MDQVMFNYILCECTYKRGMTNGKDCDDFPLRCHECKHNIRTQRTKNTYFEPVE